MVDKCFQIPIFTNASVDILQSNIKFEYVIRKDHVGHDLTRAVLKFDKNAVVMYPNCLRAIETDIREVGE